MIVNQLLKTILLLVIIIFFTSITPNAISALDLTPLKDKLETIVSNKIARIGIAIIYNGKDVITVNNDSEYPLMSVFKFHQAIAVLKKLDQNKIPLSKMIYISESDLLPDTYSPLRDAHPKANLYLSIYDLLAYSLQLSDNNACDILFNKIIGPYETSQIIHSLGIDDFSISQTENDMHINLNNCYKNWSTPLAVAELMDKTLRGLTLSMDHSEILKDMLIGCKTGAERLPKYLPLKDIVFGHKTGTGDRNCKNEIIGINDVGFIILPDGTSYIIAVLIKDSSLSYKETSEIIAHISEITFKYIESAKNVN